MSIKRKQAVFNVFRVEHCDSKLGPFHKASWDGRNGIGLDIRKHAEYNRMPCPDTDKLYSFEKGAVFAFPTIEAYMSFWEWSTLEDLKTLGFVLREYVVSTRHCLVGESGWQVVYPARLAREVRTYDLLEPWGKYNGHI